PHGDADKDAAIRDLEFVQSDAHGYAPGRRDRFANPVRGRAWLCRLDPPSEGRSSRGDHTFDIYDRQAGRQDSPDHLTEQDHPPRTIHVGVDPLYAEIECSPRPAVHAPRLVDVLE